MRKVYFTFLLAFCVLGSILAADICEEQVDGSRLAHPADCAKFVVCEQGRSVYIATCPAGLHFNRAMSECDFKHRAGCEISVPQSDIDATDDCDCCACCNCCSGGGGSCNTPAPGTPTPITPAPVTPTQITPAPGTPTPITPAPGTPTPITPAPVTPTEITPGPGTPTPITPAPGTPTPITPGPATPAPGTPTPITPAPATPAPATPTPGTPAPDTPAPGTPAPGTPAPGTPAGPSGVTCASPGKCLNQKDGAMFADSNGYIVCQCECEILMPCPPGLTFNETAGVCDWPAGSDGGTVTCDNDSTVCNNQKNGALFPVDGVCNKFYKCNFGCAVEITCPNNLVYNTNVEYCDYPQNYKCPWPYTPPSGPSAGPSGIACASGGRCVGQPEGKFYSSTTSCGKYVVCQCECEVEMTCSAGLYFNPKYNVCDYPQNVDCTI